MTQNKNTGMKLERDFSTREHSTWFLSMLTALLACISLLCMFGEMTGIQGRDNLWMMLLTAVCVCVAGGLASKVKRQNEFYLIALMIVLLFVLFFRQQILSGCCILWNSMGDEVTANTGWVIPEWELNNAAKTEEGIVIVSVLAGIVSALFSCFMNAVFGIGLAILLPGLLLAGVLFLGMNMSLLCCCIVLAASVFILISLAGWEKREGGAVLCGSILCILLLCILLPVTALSGVKNWISEYSTTVQEKIHEQRYETTDTVLPEGNLSEEPLSAGTDRTALIVTMEEPETMYLRGFTGAVFKEDRWTELDKKVLVENEDLLYWLHLNEFHSDSQFERASVGKDIDTKSVSIQNVSACSRYLYVPFHMTQNGYLTAENLKQEGVEAEGTRSYVFEVISDGSGHMQEVLKQLQESEDEEIQEYLKAENAYRAFVYEHYMQVPEEIGNLLGEIWNEVAARYGSVEQLTPQQAQECVLTILERCFAEDREVKAEQLPVSKAAGTSYQYATTAVMTLRYFGIPARYAEGYIISEEMASKVEQGESLEVNGSCAAGWPEVYQDGIGWIPMALTPGMEQEEENDQNNESEGAETIIKEGQELEEEVEETLEEPESEGGSMVTITREIKGGLLKAVLAIFLLLLLIILRRMFLMKKKEIRFSDENCKEAVGWIFADITGLLEQMGFNRKNGSMENICGPVGEKLGAEYEEGLIRMITLNARALFSSHTITEEQRKEMSDFRKTSIEHVKANTTWWKRIWMKWVKCLY